MTETKRKERQPMSDNHQPSNRLEALGADFGDGSDCISLAAALDTLIDFATEFRDRIRGHWGDTLLPQLVSAVRVVDKCTHAIVDLDEALDPPSTLQTS